MSLPIFHMVKGAPEPVAPFSHAVETDGWIFITGQLPFAGASASAPYPEGIEAQTRQVMENLKRVLAGCGLGFHNVVSVRVFLTHFEEDYPRMNTVYGGYFLRGKLPARTCVGVTALARGARVEIDLIARRAQERRRRARQ
jgi:reactive intermediate/imine deaminase